jgi:RNA 2',3'-cyclic 3'-phosphodiesterase
VRLFAAVVPPVTAIDHLDRVAAPVRVACPELRWIPTERWHLTLAFYGEVADRDVARFERRGVRATRDGVALDLRFAGAGRFGERVLWAGVDGDVAGLRALAGGLATDARPYQPHLTLARAREGGDLRAAVTMLETYDGPGWRASEVVLFRSHVRERTIGEFPNKADCGPEPRYESITRWPLAAP